MSDHRGVWGAREDAVWWPGAIAADQQQSFHHQQILHQQQQQAVQQQQQQQQQQPQSQQQQQQQQQHNDIANSVAATQQLFSYKMASTFQHPATTMSNVSAPSSIGTSGMRGGYDYRLGGGMTGGNPAMTGPSPAPPQWWYPGVMDNSMQNSIANTHQSNMQNMSPVQTPPPVTQQSQINASVQQQQAEAQVRQQQHQAAEAHRQQEVQRHQAEAQAARQQAEAQAVRQAVAEAQARHQQTQQNHLQQQNHHGQQNHHQSHQQNQVLTQAQHTQTLHQSIQQNNQSIHHLLVDHQQSTDQKSHQQITVQVPTRGRMPRGSKADARPRGRMTAYAFFVQTCREEHKKKHPEENVVFAEFSKKCSERWKTMVDKEKKRFHEMAEKDKKRYDTEMQNYTPPKGEKQRGKKRKQNKDPNAPKRSLSAFFWFCNDERGKVKGQNPEYGVGDIAKELGRRWADADSEMKSRYEAMAEKDKARYEKEMTAYKKKNNPSLPAAPVPEPQEEEEEEDEEGDEDEDD